MGLLVFAKSTLRPFCSMGVMTMKIISSTSITSTMGVTLMLELTFFPSSRTAIAISIHLSARGACGTCKGGRPGAVLRDANSDSVAQNIRDSGRSLAGAAAALQEIIDQLRRRVI